MRSAALQGLGLSLSTVLLWGLLPLALKALLPKLTPISLTWFRFTAAAFLLGAWLRSRDRIPSILGFSRSETLFFALAAAGLLGNYVFFLMGLAYLPPGSAQLVVQLAPMLTLLGSLWFFSEPFSLRQGLGVLVFASGLLAFFHDALHGLFQAPQGANLGIWTVALSATVWAGYALAQKRLLKSFDSAQILWVLYLAGAICFLPWVEPAGFLALDKVGWALLAFASLNTLLAYGAFAEAMARWEASRVSAVLALTPLATLSFSFLFASLGAPVDLPGLDAIKALGALLVVSGSTLAALGKPRIALRPATVPGPPVPIHRPEASRIPTESNRVASQAKDAR